MISSLAQMVGVTPLELSILANLASSEYLCLETMYFTIALVKRFFGSV
jgi:hypothetical protein